MFWESGAGCRFSCRILPPELHCDTNMVVCEFFVDCVKMNHHCELLYIWHITLFELVEMSFPSVSEGRSRRISGPRRAVLPRQYMIALGVFVVHLQAVFGNYEHQCDPDKCTNANGECYGTFPFTSTNQNFNTQYPNYQADNVDDSIHSYNRHGEQIARFSHAGFKSLVACVPKYNGTDSSKIECASPLFWRTKERYDQIQQYCDACDEGYVAYTTDQVMTEPANCVCQQCYDDVKHRWSGQGRCPAGQIRIWGSAQPVLPMLAYNCNLCPVGKSIGYGFQDIHDGCQTCASGKVVSVRGGTCAVCEYGDSWVDAQTCARTNCGFGNYISEGRDANGRENCAQCSEMEVSGHPNQVAMYSTGLGYNNSCHNGCPGVYDGWNGVSDVETWPKCVGCAPGKYVTVAIRDNNQCNGAGCCTSCMPGEMCDETGTMHKCPLGSFTESPDQTQCQLCGDGETTSNVGQGTADCYKCALGEYLHADMTCHTCPAGKFGHMNAEEIPVCTSCPAGNFSGALGATFCSPCPEYTDTRRSATSATKIEDCICGHLRGLELYEFPKQPQAPQCLECAPGREVRFNQCRRCWPRRNPGNNMWLGEYVRRITDERCQHCPAQSKTNENRDACACNPGYGSGDDEYAPCVACLSGTYKSGQDNTKCVDCWSHSVSGVDSSGCLCNAGYGIGNTIQNCSQCQAGKYKAAFANHVCTNCTDHSYSAAGAIQCICEDGFEVNLDSEGPIECVSIISDLDKTKSALQQTGDGIALHDILLGADLPPGATVHISQHGERKINGVVMRRGVTRWYPANIWVIHSAANAYVITL